MRNQPGDDVTDIPKPIIKHKDHRALDVVDMIHSPALRGLMARLVDKAADHIQVVAEHGGSFNPERFVKEFCEKAIKNTDDSLFENLTDYERTSYDTFVCDITLLKGKAYVQKHPPTITQSNAGGIGTALTVTIGRHSRDISDYKNW